MTRDGRSSFHWELEHCGRGCSNKVLPKDRVNVGGLWMFPARVFLPLKSAMVRIVEFDDEPFDGLSLLFHINENSTASVGETIQRVNVVHKDNLCIELQLQDCLKWRVLDATRIVHMECFHRSARVFRIDCEHFSLYLVQFGSVPGIDLGVGAVDVDSVIETGVCLGTDSSFQQGNVFTCLISCPHPVQQVS